LRGLADFFMIEVLSMEIQELTVSERIMLAEALWDSVAN
tara:strand:+ start:1136 stop:1252 length:117 start_codon:yes stop_codon:yes gene_type:complete